MSTLHLVRHGQAQLFTEDYDRLSPLGVRQAERLASRWIGEGVIPDRVYCGTLKRHLQTAEVVGARFLSEGLAWPEPDCIAGLNEYPADELLRAIAPAVKALDPGIAEAAARLEGASDAAERYRYLHRLLERVIARWIAADYADAEVPLTWQAFSTAVRQALLDITACADRGQSIAVFTSGGPIGVTVQTVLQAPDVKAAELNWRLHNGSLTRCTFSGRRVSLDAFNDVAHLSRDLLSYR